MHPIIQTFLRNFARAHSIESMGEADQFERFVNYCIITNRCPTRFDIDDVTTDDPEVGIDGVAVTIGDDLVTTADEAAALLQRRNRDVDVNYVFVQAKRSERFERDALLNLGSAVRDLMTSQALPQDDVLKEAANIHRTVIENVNRLRNGQPNVELFYVTTGAWTDDAVLVATRDQIVKDLDATRFFHEVACTPLGFDDLRREWMSTREPLEAKFAVLGELAIPTMEGVSEAIVVLVSAKEFVEHVLCDPTGKLRFSVFEQNVRHFLGPENEVNDQIRDTLLDPHKKHRFAILNNGITITANEIRRVANTVSVRDFQIVNGCQTSHVLYHNREALDSNVVLVVKAISSIEAGVVDEVVVATNSQTKVAESQFLAIKDEVRLIQNFFSTYPDDEENERHLYFERRIGEFAGREIAAIRIFDIHLLVKVFAAMFLDVPHYACGSPSRIYELSGVFRPNFEIAYYTAAFAYYRMIVMLGNQTIPRADGRLKWHVLTALRYLVLGALPLSAEPAAITAGCERVLEVVWKAPRDCLPLYQEAIALVRSLPSSGDQELRAKPFTDRLIMRAKEKQRRSPRKTR